jgi:uncharacterized protein (DUF433 family)
MELDLTDAGPLITSDPKIMMGKPTITGTRITVELILDKLAAGESVETRSYRSILAYHGKHPRGASPTQA